MLFAGRLLHALFCMVFGQYGPGRMFGFFVAREIGQFGRHHEHDEHREETNHHHTASYVWQSIIHGELLANCGKEKQGKK